MLRPPHLFLDAQRFFQQGPGLLILKLRDTNHDEGDGQRDGGSSLPLSLLCGEVVEQTVRRVAEFKCSWIQGWRLRKSRCGFV